MLRKNQRHAISRESTVSHTIAGPNEYAVTDIIRGDVLFACSVTANVATLIQSGRIKAPGLLAPKRIAAFPDVPSFAELGLPDVDVTSWSGIAVPLATPPTVRRPLGVMLREITDDPVHAKAFAALGLETAYLPMEPFGAEPLETIAVSNE